MAFYHSTSGLNLKVSRPDVKDEDNLAQSGWWAPHPLRRYPRFSQDCWELKGGRAGQVGARLTMQARFYYLVDGNKGRCLLQSWTCDCSLSFNTPLSPGYSKRTKLSAFLHSKHSNCRPNHRSSKGQLKCEVCFLPKNTPLAGGDWGEGTWTMVVTLPPTSCLSHLERR